MWVGKRALEDHAWISDPSTRRMQALCTEAERVEGGRFVVGGQGAGFIAHLRLAMFEMPV